MGKWRHFFPQGFLVPGEEILANFIKAQLHLKYKGPDSKFYI